MTKGEKPKRRITSEAHGHDHGHGQASDHKGKTTSSGPDNTPSTTDIRSAYSQARVNLAKKRADGENVGVFEILKSIVKGVSQTRSEKRVLDTWKQVIQEIKLERLNLESIQNLDSKEWPNLVREVMTILDDIFESTEAGPNAQALKEQRNQIIEANIATVKAAEEMLANLFTNTEKSSRDYKNLSAQMEEDIARFEAFLSKIGGNLDSLKALMAQLSTPPSADVTELIISLSGGLPLEQLHEAYLKMLKLKEDNLKMKENEVLDMQEEQRRTLEGQQILPGGAAALAAAAADKIDQRKKVTSPDSTGLDLPRERENVAGPGANEQYQCERELPRSTTSSARVGIAPEEPIEFEVLPDKVTSPSPNLSTENSTTDAQGATEKSTTNDSRQDGQDSSERVFETVPIANPRRPSIESQDLSVYGATRVDCWSNGTNSDLNSRAMRDEQNLTRFSKNRTTETRSVSLSKASNEGVTGDAAQDRQESLSSAERAESKGQVLSTVTTLPNLVEEEEDMLKTVNANLIERKEATDGRSAATGEKEGQQIGNGNGSLTGASSAATWDKEGRQIGNVSLTDATSAATGQKEGQRIGSAVMGEKLWDDQLGDGPSLPASSLFNRTPMVPPMTGKTDARSAAMKEKYQIGDGQLVHTPAFSLLNHVHTTGKTEGIPLPNTPLIPNHHDQESYGSGPQSLAPNQYVTPMEGSGDTLPESPKLEDGKSKKNNQRTEAKDQPPWASISSIFPSASGGHLNQGSADFLDFSMSRGSNMYAAGDDEDVVLWSRPGSSKKPKFRGNRRRPPRHGIVLTASNEIRLASKLQTMKAKVLGLGRTSVKFSF